MVYKNLSWPFGSLSRRILMYVPLFILVDYFVTPFSLLGIQRSLQFWSSFHYFGHWILIALTVALFGCAKVSSRKVNASQL